MSSSWDRVKMAKVWGEYFGYPTCCIEDFSERLGRGEHAPTRTQESPFLGSGFIPCVCCHEKTKNLSFEGAQKFLGLKLSDKEVRWTDMYGDTAKEVKSKKYKKIAERIGFDYSNYLSWLVYEDKQRKLQLKS